VGDTRISPLKQPACGKVDWESLPTSSLSSAGALDGQPQSWLTSFRWQNKRLTSFNNASFPPSACWILALS
jgi:predicted lysophospholipase L1 biosynthesis ABC-type transport system permease subunit